jgi:hypothetical protein
VHAASELTAVAAAAEGPSGPNRVQSTHLMGMRTGSLARFVQVLFVHSIPPAGHTHTHTHTQPDSQTRREEFYVWPFTEFVAQNYTAT